MGRQGPEATTEGSRDTGVSHSHLSPAYLEAAPHWSPQFSLANL